MEISASGYELPEPIDAPTADGASVNRYLGPYVYSRQHSGGLDWLWIANGMRNADQVFGPPATQSEEPRRPSSIGDVAVATSKAGHQDVVSGRTVNEPAARILVLGPIEVEGWQHVPERAIVAELACFLSLHPGRVFPGDQLRFLLRPDGETEINAKSLRTYVSLLRAALGSDLVPAGTVGGYTISPDVATDWGEFQALSGPGAGREALEAALALVRGRPFAGVQQGTFGWIYSELLISEIEVRIVDVAIRLIALYQKAWDHRSVIVAARRALLAVPGEISLWQSYVESAYRVGPGEWVAAVRDAQKTIGEDAALAWDAEVMDPDLTDVGLTTMWLVAQGQVGE